MKISVADAPQLDPEQLARFWPMQQISDDGIAILSTKVKVARLPANKVLINKTQRLPIRFYLLEGSIKLKSVYGHTKTLRAEDEEALRPVDMALPELDQATSASPVRLLGVMPRDLVKTNPRVIEKKLPPHMAHLAALVAGENPLENAINKAVEKNGLPLPQISPVAFKVMNKASQANIEAKDIGAIIEEDEKLANRIIKIANSPQFRGSAIAVSAFEAVSRIGIKTTTSLVISASLRRIFEADDLKIKKRLNEAWAKSVRVAAESFALAKITGACDPEDALLGGLLHQIGVPGVCHFADQHRELLWKVKELDTAINDLKHIVGRRTLVSWDMDSAFADMVEQVDNPHRGNGQSEPDFADVIQAAYFYNQPSSHPFGPEQLFHELRCVQRLQLPRLTKEHQLEPLLEMEEEINGLCDALRH